MMEKIYGRTKGIRDDMVVGFCPGCMHGTIFKLIGEVLEELNMLEKTITVHGVGCCGLAMEYVTYDCTTSPHGRACAVATGVKRAEPDKLVFTYQGDGDLASIGLAETMSAANRGENITVIFVNNGIYGMTGGQMAPTTLLGQKTTTSPRGRDMARHEGGPIRMAELMAQLSGVAYSERCALDSVKHVRAAKKALRKAFEVQLQGLGFGFVELLSGCPTNWHMDPVSANRRISEAMIPVFPLGVYKDVTAQAESEVQHG